MIDYQSDIFDTVADQLIQKRPDVNVVSDLSAGEPDFPSVLIEESQNLDTQIDNAEQSQFAELQYRITIQTNKAGTRMSDARAILADVDTILQSLNFRRTAMVTQSGLYTNSAYKIVATYKAAIDVNGVLYLRR